MSYIFKFKNNDVLINSIKSYPDISFDIYGPVAYYNNRLPVSGAFTGSVLSCTPGYLSLYEMNVDRSGSAGLDKALPTQADGTPGLPPFEAAVKAGVDAATFYTDGRAGGPCLGNPIIRPFTVKDGTRMGYKTVSKATFNAERIGQVMSTHYPLTASISKEYWARSDAKMVVANVSPKDDDGAETTIQGSGSVSHLMALINTMNYYQKLSPHYAVSSSQWTVAPTPSGTPGRNLTGSSVAAEGPDDMPGNEPAKVYTTACPQACDVGLVSIPSIFYGSAIKKGSVVLKTYLSGTLAAQLEDINRNGELIQTLPVGVTGTGSVAGVVLYNEGFIVLTGSWDFSDGRHTEDYTGSSTPPAWKFFGQSLAAYPASTTPSSSYFLGFNGTTITPTLTMFAHAKKNQLNHSNNPTYVTNDKTRILSTGSQGYIENENLEIKNTVSSSYNDPTGSFMKTTYITKIAIYDENKNLLGVAKLAKPVRKLEDRDFTFKLKLDI